MADVNITIVEDDRRYRDSLETLFSRAPGFALAGSYASATRAIEVAETLVSGVEGMRWDVVFMDIELPGINGIDAVARLKALCPEVLVIMLTVFEEPRTILQAICAGADGYLLKKTSARELLAQARAVVAGGSPLSADVARVVFDLVRGGKSSSAANRVNGIRSPSRLSLTPREQDVLRCLVKGAAYKRTAAELGISIDTVRSHIRSIYRKLQVKSVAEAVARAIREQLV